MGITRGLISYVWILFIVMGCSNGGARDKIIEEEKKVFNCVVDYLDKELLNDVPYSINPTLYEVVDTALFRKQILLGLDSLFNSNDLDRMINKYEKSKLGYVKKYLYPKHYGKINATYDERCMTIFSLPLIKDENIGVVVVGIREFVSKNEYAGDDVMYICIKKNDEWKVEMYTVMR